MPLDRSGSKSSVGANIRTEKAAHPEMKNSQAVAIALDVMRRARKGRAMGGRAEGGPPPLPTDGDVLAERILYGSGKNEVPHEHTFSGLVPGLAKEAGKAADAYPPSISGEPWWGSRAINRALGLPERAMGGRAEGGPPPEQSLTSYEPTWRDRAAMAMRRLTGDDDKMMSPEMDRVVTGITGATGAGNKPGASLFDYLPSAVATKGADTAESISRDNPVGALINGAEAFAPRGFSLMAKGAGKVLGAGERELTSMSHDPFGHLAPEDRESVNGIWDTIDNMRGYRTTPEQRLLESQSLGPAYAPEAASGRSSMAGHRFRDEPSSGGYGRPTASAVEPGSTPPSPAQSRFLDALDGGKAADEAGELPDYIRPGTGASYPTRSATPEGRSQSFDDLYDMDPDKSTMHAKGGIARAKGGRTDDDDMSFPEMVSHNPHGWGPEGDTLDPERPPSPNEIEMAREILRQRDAVGNPDADVADTLGRFGGDIIKTPVTAGHSIAEAARDPRPSTITKAGIDTAMIPLLFAGPEQGVLREGAAKAMAGIGMGGLGAGIAYDTGVTPRAAMEAFVPSAEAMGAKGRAAAEAELGMAPGSLKGRDDDEINAMRDAATKGRLAGSQKAADEKAASETRLHEEELRAKTGREDAAAKAEQGRKDAEAAAGLKRQQDELNQKAGLKQNLREANTPFKIAMPETAAAIPYATAGVGAALGLGMGAREAASFNEAASGLSARSKAAAEAAEAALGKNPMKANMNIELAKRLAAEQAGLKTGPKWYKGPAFLGGVGGELGQAAPYVIDYAKAPGRPDAEGHNLHDDTVAAISDPKQVAARIVQGALWGAGPAKIGQGLALLKKRAVPSFLPNAEALEATTGAAAPGRFKEMAAATKAATEATPGYTKPPRAPKAAATNAPAGPQAAGLDPLSATVQETLAAKAAGAPAPVPTGSGAPPPGLPAPSAAATPARSAAPPALPPPTPAPAAAPTSSPSPVKAAPDSIPSAGPVQEKRGLRLWSHGGKNYWRHGPGKSEGGRFTKTPGGANKVTSSPNSEELGMDENGIWKKPDMPVEDRFQAGGAVGTLLGMARKLRARGGGVAGARAFGHPHVGPVEGPTGGRTDALPISVPHNAYVIPADVVSHYGEGNTAAGMQVMKKMFGGSHTPTGTSMPMGHLNGHANGGGVPIKISDGEYVVAPEEVARRGGGSVDIGNRALDQFVLNSRKAHIDLLSKLPGPAQ